MTRTKIDRENLMPFAGQTVTISCVTGTVFELTGKLVVNYGFCWYAVDIGAERMIGFSFGTFTRDGDRIRIQIQ